MADLFDRVLQFKTHLRLEPMDGERAFLLGEREHFMLTGRAQVRVAPLLDGRRTVREVLAQLGDSVSPPEAFYALTQLEQSGFVVDAAPDVPARTAAFWQSLGVAPALVHARLAATPVRVRALDGLETEPFAQALRTVGLPVADTAPFQVLLVRDYLSPALESFNRDALARREPWMLVKPTGALPWMGPVFRPGEGPCHACLAQRLRWNRPVETYLRARSGHPEPLTPPRADVPASLQLAWEFAALTLTRGLVGAGPAAIERTLQELDLPRMQLTAHTVVRRPQCPACGDASLLATRAARPLVLESRPKPFIQDNGYRSVSPEETFARYQHHISPITGVLSSLGPIEGRDHPMRPVYGASYFTPPRDNRPAADDFHWMSAGKGRTPAQSRASALCEGLERISAFRQGDEPRVHARMEDLGADALHPHALLNFSDTQYRERPAPGPVRPKYFIPAPFDERWETDWTPVWSLTHERRRYLPSAWCYTRHPLPPEQRFCQQDSNGHAAGNCLEEAILQGFLELVERDAVALWWYNRVRRPGVDLKAFDPLYGPALEAHYAEQGWRLWALDLTHDLGLPTFVALGRARDGRYCVGFGAHLDARLALYRALTEINQLHDPRRTLPPPWDAAALEDPSYLLPDERVPASTPATFPTVTSADLRDDVRTCVERAARVGLETLVLDLTRPDLGLSVVKVAVPGLRHFWPRFGPGRLYDVPVRLGWRSTPLTEAQLNPVHLYL